MSYKTLTSRQFYLITILKMRLILQVNLIVEGTALKTTNQFMPTKVLLLLSGFTIAPNVHSFCEYSYTIPSPKCCVDKR